MQSRSNALQLLAAGWEHPGKPCMHVDRPASACAVDLQLTEKRPVIKDV